ncbi:ATP-binding protein, partial [Streptomyces sp. NPDC003860]
MNKEITQPATATRQFSVQLSATRRGARLARLLAIQQLQSWGCEHAS